jgi:hypothetical protein
MRPHCSAPILIELYLAEYELFTGDCGPRTVQVRATSREGTDACNSPAYRATERLSVRRGPR